MQSSTPSLRSLPVRPLPGGRWHRLLLAFTLASVSLPSFGQTDDPAAKTTDDASAPVAPVAAPPLRLTLGTGFDYSRGDYGFATNTEVTSIPLEANYETGPWLFRATLPPYLRVSGPATVVVGGGSTARPISTSETGVGDLDLAATYQFGSVFGPTLGPINLATTTRLKLPIADKSRGLGTGATDFAGEIEFSRHAGSLTPFLHVGYRVLGDNALYQLRDGANFGGGAHYRASDRTVLTAAFDWRSRLGRGLANSSEILVAATHDLNRQWRLLGYTLAGFTNASPDFGFGVHLSRRF